MSRLQAKGAALLQSGLSRGGLSEASCPPHQDGQAEGETDGQPAGVSQQHEGGGPGERPEGRLQLQVERSGVHLVPQPALR